MFNSSDRPGGGMRVTIRGKGSINKSNQPYTLMVLLVWILNW